MIDHISLKNKLILQFKLILSNKSLIKDLLGKTRYREGKISNIDYLSLILFYHINKFSSIKHFYHFYVCFKFKNPPAYVNFLANFNKLGVLFIELLELKMIKNRYINKAFDNNFYYLDSTKIEVSKNYWFGKIHRRKYQNDIFDIFLDPSSKGKSSTGDFIGYKLSCLLDRQDRLLNINICSGSVHDVFVLDDKKFFNFKDLKSKTVLCDSGYISKDRYKKLKEEKNIIILSKPRKNCKNCYYTQEEEKILKEKYKTRQTIERYFKKLKIDLNLKNSILNLHHKTESLLVTLFANLFITQF